MYLFQFLSPLRLLFHKPSQFHLLSHQQKYILLFPQHPDFLFFLQQYPGPSCLVLSVKKTREGHSAQLQLPKLANAAEHSVSDPSEKIHLSTNLRPHSLLNNDVELFSLWLDCQTKPLWADSFSTTALKYLENTFWIVAGSTVFYMI